jgi:methylmalonyl-CoA/ethylmalonyl-CoA epimerase
MSELLRLHHLGWAVGSIAASMPTWTESIGLPDLGFEQFPGIDVQFFGAGECMIELLESHGGDPTVEKLVEHRGGGLHHLAFGVPDVGETLNEAARRGLCKIDEVPRPGARGTMIAFVDPGWLDGTLVEFVQDPTWRW